jgi:hypothetical protein
MIWQDILFMIGNFTLGAALIPTVLAKEKPSLLTSALTGVVLYSYCLAFATLNLQLAAIAVGVNASLWIVLLVQKWRKHGSSS